MANDPGQLRQVTPPVPHAAVVVPGTHCPASSQQPSQVFSLQPGAFSQCRETTLQVSPGWQVTHASPFVPQKESFRPGWQTFSRSQQPRGQTSALQIGVPWHAPLTLQVWPGRQALQAVPPAPQADGELPGWQAPLASQQPVGQFWALQVTGPTHWPLA